MSPSPRHRASAPILVTVALGPAVVAAVIGAVAVGAAGAVVFGVVFGGILGGLAVLFALFLGWWTHRS